MPLLSAYSGLRLEELAGLRTCDLESDEDRYFLRIRPTDDRPLKSAAAKRRVPVHPVIVRLGFLDYVTHVRRTTDSARLFPDLRLGADQRWGSAYSKKFGRLLNRLELRDPRLVFHSFRHSFVTAMLSATGGDFDLVERLVGHSLAGKGETRGRYGKDRRPRELWDALSRLSYGLEVLGEAHNEVVAQKLATPQPFFDEEEDRGDGGPDGRDAERVQYFQTSAVPSRQRMRSGEGRSDRQKQRASSSSALCQTEAAAPP
jgi:hypothetical protein